MELDDFKQTWQQASVNTNTNRDIMEIIKHKSYGPIAALKRQFKKQIGVMIFIPFALLLTNADDISKPLTSVMFWSYVAFCIAMISFSYHNYRIVDKIEGMDGVVKTNLEQQIDVLETRLQRNIISLRLVMLLFIVLAEVMPYFQHYGMLDKWHSLSPLIRFGVYAFVLLLQYFASKRILQAKFGGHLTYLKSLVKDMQ